MATNNQNSSWLKRVVIGAPIATSEDSHQRLSKKVALPVFASDAISSTAYATQEILIVFLSLAAVGTAAYSRLVPISFMVIGLLVIVVFSYRQTIYAYPTGGGSYVVSRENLGKYPSLVAGGSMLTDYILTVAVSVSGGVAAIISTFSHLAPYRVHMQLDSFCSSLLPTFEGSKNLDRYLLRPHISTSFAFSG